MTSPTSGSTACSRWPWWRRCCSAPCSRTRCSCRGGRYSAPWPWPPSSRSPSVLSPPPQTRCVLVSCFLPLSCKLGSLEVLESCNYDVHLQTPGLNIITEYVMGLIMPGKPIANVCFKVYGYISMNQAVSFLTDFKLGHYMKIPPRSMFLVQVLLPAHIFISLKSQLNPLYNQENIRISSSGRSWRGR